MRRPPPTIRDVALRADVSLGTASQVLNGKGSVGEARRERVLRAASEIGYRPNRLARSLRQQKTNVIGLCAPMISSAYFAAFLEAVDELSGVGDHQVMQVLSGGDPLRERARVESLIGRQVDGIILMPTMRPAATLDLIAGSHVPAVVVDRIGDETRFDLLQLDHAGSMRDVAEHLLGLGHERFLFVVRHPALVTTKLRIDALQAALASAGRPPADVLATTQEERDLPDQLKRRVGGRSGATAVITSNSINTLWTLRALRSEGLAIPGTVSIVAFDEPAWGELVEPPLTVVRQPTRQLAERAWRLLTERISNPGAPQRREMLSTELVVRSSTAPHGPRRGG